MYRYETKDLEYGYGYEMACEGNMYNQLPGTFLGVVHKIRNTIGESRNQSRD